MLLLITIYPQKKNVEKKKSKHKEEKSVIQILSIT